MSDLSVAVANDLLEVLFKRLKKEHSTMILKLTTNQRPKSGLTWIR